MKKILMCLLLLASVCAGATAQSQTETKVINGKEYAPRKYDWWLGGSIGVTHSLAENATSDDFVHNYPGVDMQLGTFFNRCVGWRLSWGLNPQLGRPGKAQREGDPETYDTHYRFNVLTGYTDLLVDLTTIFSKRKKYRPSFDVLMYGGVGALESFHFDQKVKDWEYYPVDATDKTCWAAHFGLMASYRLSAHWDWMLEGSYNFTESRYDGIEGNVALSGYVKLHTGLVYHFHDRSNQQVRLTTTDDSGWEPSYTDKDREKIRQREQERLKKVSQQNAKMRQKRQREVAKHNVETKERNKKLYKERKRLEKRNSDARLYNEY